MFLSRPFFRQTSYFTFQKANSDENVHLSTKKGEAVVSKVSTLSVADLCVPEGKVTPETDAVIQLLHLGIPQKEAEEAIKFFGIHNIDKAADYCFRVNSGLKTQRKFA